MIKCALKCRSKLLTMERENEDQENIIQNTGYQSELDVNQLDSISVVSFESALKDSIVILPNNLPTYDEYIKKSKN